MAAKENQGLHIALIVFVILTILISAYTYVLFKQKVEAEDKYKAAVAQKADADAKVADQDNNLKAVLSIVGYADDAKKATTEIKSDIDEKYGPAVFQANVPDTDKNLKKVLAALGETISAKEQTAADRDKSLQVATKQLADAQSAAAKIAADLTAARKAAEDERDSERTKYNASVQELTTLKESLIKEKADKNKAMDEQKSGYEKKLADLTVKLAAANKDIEKLTTELKKYYQIDASSGGAKITMVNQRSNLAYINLGSDDGLQRRITFSVYPPGTTDVSKAAPKGKIEVINVTGPSIAEARIVESSDKDPILAGDLIHTQGWHPGQHEHFAIAGYVDIDGAGSDQTRKLHDLIVANGGIVDAEIIPVKDKNGTGLQIRGSINVNTRYLVVGEVGTDKTGDKGRLEKTTILKTEAKRLGVDEIGLQKFLGMMGYTTRSGAGGVTNNGPATANAAATTGVDTEGFRPRQPPARGADNGAF